MKKYPVADFMTTLDTFKQNLMTFPKVVLFFLAIATAIFLLIVMPLLLLVSAMNLWGFTMMQHGIDPITMFFIMMMFVIIATGREYAKLMNWPKCGRCGLRMNITGRKGCGKGALMTFRCPDRHASVVMASR